MVIEGIDKPRDMDIIGYGPPTKGGPIIRIRRYASEYADATVKLARRMHTESKYAHKRFDEGAVRQFLSHIDNERLAGFLAVHKQQGLIGFYALDIGPCIFSYNRIATGIALYVIPEMRHTIAFAGLMRAGERWAAKRGAMAIVEGISAAHDPAKAARAFNKLGYETTGVMLHKELP